MKKTWKPKVVGIVNIVVAIISLWFLGAMSLEGAVFWSIFPKSMFGLNIPSTVYLVIVIPLLCIVILQDQSKISVAGQLMENAQKIQNAKLMAVQTKFAVLNKKQKQ